MRKIKFTTAAAVIAAVTIMTACRFIAGGAEGTSKSQPEISYQQALDQWSRVLLLKVAEAEAGTEDIQGKALVMQVVLNRVASEDFPDSVYDVLYQQNQFTTVENKSFLDIIPDSDCYEALILLDGGWDESCGALYFDSVNNTNNWHSRHLEWLFTYGNHNFYK